MERDLYVDLLALCGHDRHPPDRRAFKVFALDVGLLGATVEAPAEWVVHGERLFTEYRGALTESYVAQQLIAAGHSGLFYRRSPGGKAELDFLFEGEGAVVPVEVKAGLNRRSKRLKSYDKRTASPVLVRANLQNLTLNGTICNVPLYAVFWLPQVCQTRATGGKVWLSSTASHASSSTVGR